MSIASLFLGCFLLYGKSIYFPEHINNIGSIIKNKKQITNSIGYLFLLFSYILLGIKYGWGTGFVIYLISIGFVYSLVLMILSLNKRYIYIISILSVLLIITLETTL